MKNRAGRPIYLMILVFRTTTSFNQTKKDLFWPGVKKIILKTPDKK